MKRKSAPNEAIPHQTGFGVMTGEQLREMGKP